MKEEKKILIVDDDKSILEVFKQVLQSRGYRTDTAQTGQEAIGKSKAEYYNLALLDIKLPDMEGTELLTAMHSDTPKMMKIMVTGYPDIRNAVEALNKGADAYIIKPVEPEKLLRTVTEKLEEQEEAEKMSEEKVTQWIETRARKMERR